MLMRFGGGDLGDLDTRGGKVIGTFGGVDFGLVCMTSRAFCTLSLEVLLDVSKYEASSPRVRSPQLLGGSS